MSSSAAIGGEFPGLRFGTSTTVINGPRTPSGRPDYRQAIANRLSQGVAPEENAWCAISETFNPEKLVPSYVAALKAEPGFENAGRIPFPLEPDDRESRDAIRAELEAANGRTWKLEEFPRVARWLEANRGALDQVCGAVSRPQAYAPIIVPEGAPLHDSNLAHAQHARELAHALAVRAGLSIGSGQFDDAWSDVLAGHRLARHVARGFTSIELLVGYLIVSVLNDATVSAIVSTPGGVDAVADRWRAIEPLLLSDVSLADRLEFERLMVLEATLMIREKRAVADSLFFEDAPLQNNRGLLGLPTLYGEWLWRFLRWKALCCNDVNEQLEFTNRYFDESIKVLDRRGIQNRERGFQSIEVHYLAQPTPPSRYQGLRKLVSEAVSGLRRMMLIAILRKYAIPFEHFDEAARRNSQKNRLFLAATLAEMHYRDAGRDIESGKELASLREKYMPGSEELQPIDLYHKQPLRVRRRAEEFVIYSVGPNRRDDEGRTFHPQADQDDFTVRLPRPKPE